MFLSRLSRQVCIESDEFATVRVALLSSFSIEFVQHALRAHGFLERLNVEIYQAGFGQFRQEILDPQSNLYSFQADVVILAVEGAELAPHLYARFIESEPEQRSRDEKSVVEELNQLIGFFRSQCDATLLIHNLLPPLSPALGILDASMPDGQSAAVHRINSSITQIVARTPSVFVLDFCGLIARYGWYNWHDERMALYARVPVRQKMLPVLAGEYMKFLRDLNGRSRKCLVLDLDNTLWGGVLGEEGVNGIQLGTEYPGNAFVAFQRSILELHQRGVILAIASKNNPSDVNEVFDEHPYMVLQPEHFAEAQINWDPKSISLRRIASNLSIGLEHVVFADDNPVEIDQVMKELPMITAILLPESPEQLTPILTADGLFDKLSYSVEDKNRGELYRQRAQAESFRDAATSLEEFWRGLEMELWFAPVTESSLARASQLTQKTNQFNLTTRRYSESDIAERIEVQSWRVTTLRVEDRFGNNGIVGLTMAFARGDTLEIDTFLLSCRVIGRSIETAMLAELSDACMELGLCRLRGAVIPTPKNVPARDLFDKHGFQMIAEESSGTTYWERDVSIERISFPDWYRVHNK